MDGVPAYVNAQALSISRGRALIAGYPNYVWSDTGSTRAPNPVTDSLFGVVIDADRRAEAVPRPMAGHLNHVHAAPRPGGGWRVVFAELAESIHTTLSADILGLWSGVYDGREWSELERLPVPDGYEVRYLERASLARWNDGVAFAAIVDPAEQVVLFERDGGRWSAERVAVPSDKRFPEPVAVQNIALVPSRWGPAVLTEKTDPRIDTLFQSLVLYTREPDWRERKVVVGLDRLANWQFSASTAHGLDVVSWVSEGEVYAYSGRLRAGGLRGFTVDRSSTRGAGLSRIKARAVRLPDGTPLWVTQPETLDYSGEIRFLIALGNSVARVGTLTHPNWDLQAAQATGDELVLAAAQFSRDPRRAVTSLLSRVRVACEARTLGQNQIVIPVLPPDTIPADYRENWAPALGAPRDMVTIIFRPGTSIERKAEAIALIRGRVVGGSRFPPGDPLEGIYLIRIPDTGTVEAALRAVDRLKELPFVHAASLLIEGVR